jgi:hypothetical protein
MSPAAGGGDEGGEAWSKRDRRRGRGGGSPVDRCRHEAEERRGATECSGARS